MPRHQRNRFTELPGTARNIDSRLFVLVITVLALAIRLFSLPQRGFLYEHEAVAALSSQEWINRIRGQSPEGGSDLFLPGASGGPVHEITLIPAAFFGKAKDFGAYHLISACAGAAIIPIGMLIATSIAGPPAGIAAGLLLAFSPSMILWAGGAMPHALAVLLALSSIMLWYSSGSPIVHFISGVFIAAALATFAPVASILPAILSFGMIRAMRRKLPFIVFPAGLLSGVGLISFVTHMAGGSWPLSPFGELQTKMIGDVAAVRTSLADFLAYLLHVEGAPAASIILLALIWSGLSAVKKRSAEPLFWGALIICAWIIPVLFSDNRPGAGALALVTGYIAGASGLAHLLSAVARRSVAAANSMFITVLLVTAVFFLSSMFEVLALQSGYLKATEAISDLEGRVYSSSPALISFFRTHAVQPESFAFPANDAFFHGGRTDRENRIVLLDWRYNQLIPETWEPFARIPNPAGTSPLAHSEEPRVASSNVWLSAIRGSGRAFSGEILVYFHSGIR